ncbi:Glycosyl transferase [Pseudomonas sp. IT-P218]
MLWSIRRERRMCFDSGCKSAAKRQLMMGLRLGEPGYRVTTDSGFSDFWRLVWAQPAVYLEQPLAVWAVTTLFLRLAPRGESDVI